MSGAPHDPTFPTAVNYESGGESPQGGRRRLSPALGASVFHARVDIDDGTKPLPKTVPIEPIIESIAEDAPFAQGMQKIFWQQQLRKPSVENLVAQLFWFVVAFKCQRTPYSEDNAIFDFAAEHYVETMVSIPKARRDYFLQHFREVLTGMVLLSLSMGFAKDAPRFEERGFRAGVYDLFSWLLSGQRDSSELQADHWLHTATDSMRLRKKSSLGVDKANLVQMQAYQAQTSRGEVDAPKEEPLHVVHVRNLHNLKFSPLVDRHLRRHGAPTHKTLELRIGLTQTADRPIVGGMGDIGLVQIGAPPAKDTTGSTATGASVGSDAPQRRRSMASRPWGRNIKGEPTTSAREIVHAVESSLDKLRERHAEDIKTIHREGRRTRRSYDAKVQKISEEYGAVKASGEVREFSELLLKTMRVPRNAVGKKDKNMHTNGGSAKEEM
mmetsp:Transcript_23542/g.73872  ORF Transcript_23542/g.73872 Transcript_23542/m.73872 type:complete len:440 (-) Transcript_23542:339-1658(-)|eukprot:CAMPEP_0118853948 /NCGR_PEP_ID=MMETSP1163-20130328/2342_1 /TAXON_ID=124430 /ORGANISM="Phaeomonas parva, Strain CCMP2877" /LENGTH=439 /DNA_ID=CAMNT_0006786579 /DNA_START=239 /DNA_END=1558 /DNA_ORIENTATION=-